MTGNGTDFESIFFAARDKPLRDRAAYLDEVCGADRALRQRLEQFLDAQVELGDFLETPVLESLAERLEAQAIALGTQAELPCPDAEATPLDFLVTSEKPNSLG